MKLPPTFGNSKNTIHAIIETPRRSSCKFDYDPENDFFYLDKMLPAGTSFPLDFGFIPHTMAEDGDPLDVLVLMEITSFTGCIVECRVLGVLEAEQKEKSKKAIRNDRIIAVASASSSYSHLKEINDVNENILDELVHFFKYYNKMEGRKFQLIRKGNKETAMQLISQAY